MKLCTLTLAFASFCQAATINVLGSHYIELNTGDELVIEVSLGDWRNRKGEEAPSYCNLIMTGVAPADANAILDLRLFMESDTSTSNWTFWSGPMRNRTKHKLFEPYDGRDLRGGTLVDNWWEGDALSIVSEFHVADIQNDPNGRFWTPPTFFNGLQTLRFRAINDGVPLTFGYPYRPFDNGGSIVGAVIGGYGAGSLLSAVVITPEAHSPEPLSYLLVGGGLLALLRLRRSRPHGG